MYLGLRTRSRSMFQAQNYTQVNSAYVKSFTRIQNVSSIHPFYMRSTSDCLFEVRVDLTHWSYNLISDNLSVHCKEVRSSFHLFLKHIQQIISG